MSNGRSSRRDVQGALILIAPDGRVEINPEAEPPKTAAEALRETQSVVLRPPLNAATQAVAAA